MAFTKKTWTDRVSEQPQRRLLTPTDGGTAMTVDVTRQEGMVIQEGDAFSAANMNNLETRIKNTFDSDEATINTINNRSNTNATNISTLQGNVNSISARVTTNTNNINSVSTRVGTLENEFTANGKRIYLDYKNGKYGINTAAGRGADTFIPFNNLDDVKVYSNQWTYDRGGESHDSGVFARYTLQQRSKVYVQCAAVTASGAGGGCWSNVTNGNIYPAGTVIEFSYSYDSEYWNYNMQYVASLAAIST